jgi:hypothetical protein
LTNLEPDRSHYKKDSFNKLFDATAAKGWNTVVHIDTNTKKLALFVLDAKRTPITKREFVDKNEYIDVAAERFHKRLVEEKLLDE